jgi:hypothetical protein
VPLSQLDSGAIAVLVPWRELLTRKTLQHRNKIGFVLHFSLLCHNSRYFGLNEDAIEAEAMTFAAADLEKFDRVLASREWRLDKARLF